MFKSKFQIFPSKSQKPTQFCIPMLLIKKSIGVHRCPVHPAPCAQRLHMLFFFLILLLFTNCVRFKIDNLKPTLLGKIKIGTDLTEVEGQVVNNALINIPFRIPINANRLYITDYNNSYVKVYGNDGDLDFIIGNVPTKNNLKVKVLNQKFGKSKTAL